MTHWRKRLKKGLLWPTDKPPSLTLNDWLAIGIIIITALLIYAVISGEQAHAGLAKAQAQQDIAERSIITLLEEKPLVLDKGTGMVALAKVEIAGEDGHE